MASQARATGPSEASLKLEAEYWAIKGRALKKKADAIAAHAKVESESGRQSTSETATAEAEAELTLAEVKLCELNALRVKEALEVAEVGKLKWGDKGPRVEALQRALNARVSSSPKLDVDGDFGGLTQQAVMKFQKARGLKADGVVDAATAAALGSRELAASTLTFDLGEMRRQQALVQAKALEAGARAKQAAKSAIAAAEQSARQAQQAAEAEIREEAARLAEEDRYGPPASPPEPSTRIKTKPQALIEMERQLKELQKANEKLQKRLQELESQQPSRD